MALFWQQLAPFIGKIFQLFLISYVKILTGLLPTWHAVCKTAKLLLPFTMENYL